MHAPQPNSWTAQMPAYHPGGKSKIATASGKPEIRLCSNENPYGKQRLAELAAETAAIDLSRYPDNGNLELRQALAESCQVDARNILVGNGSSEILALVARAFLNQTRVAVRPTHAFSLFSAVSHSVGAGVIEVPDRSYRCDTEALADAAVLNQADVVFIDNPCNPTGNFVDGTALSRMLERIPSSTLVVLDEAYAEYVTSPHFSSFASRVNDYPNLLVVKTLSKAYGLAGLRLGYGIGNPRLINWLERIRPPFSVNGIAASLATEAVKDQAFVQACREHNARQRQILLMEPTLAAMAVTDNCANFLFLSTPWAEEIAEGLLEAGIRVRQFCEHPGHLRITIGTPDENTRLLLAWRALKLPKHKEGVAA